MKKIVTFHKLFLAVYRKSGDTQSVATHLGGRLYTWRTQTLEDLGNSSHKTRGNYSPFTKPRHKYAFMARNLILKSHTDLVKTKAEMLRRVTALPYIPIAPKNLYFRSLFVDIGHKQPSNIKFIENMGPYKPAVMVVCAMFAASVKPPVSQPGQRDASIRGSVTARINLSYRSQYPYL